MNGRARRCKSLSLVLVSLWILVGLSGCQTGRMTVHERFYLAVPSGDNTNYYRVSVNADTVLSKAKYSSGWFPADTVDRLYGSTTEPGAASTLKTEENIKVMLNDAIEETTRGYLLAAKNPATSDEDILAWLSAQRRVRAVAGDGIALPAGAIEIEYDPSANLALRHAGEKLIFVLSSNPDEVIGAIQTFSNDTKTSATVLRFADVVRQQSLNQVEQADAVNSANARMDTVIVRQIQNSLASIESMSTPDRQSLLAEVEMLLMLVENVQ